MGLQLQQSGLQEATFDSAGEMVTNLVLLGRSIPALLPLLGAIVPCVVVPVIMTLHVRLCSAE
jgi:hypothetical protein